MFQTWFIAPHITNRDWETEPPQNATERLNATLDLVEENPAGGAGL
jgi:hypothetical protein